MNTQKLQTLLADLQSENPTEQERACNELAAQRYDPAIPSLVALLDHQDLDVNANAAFLLAQWRVTKAIELLLARVLAGHDSAHIFITALAKFGDPRVIDPLIPLLGHHDAAIRWEVGNLVCKLGNSNLLEMFLLALENEASAWRESAVRIVARFGGPEIMPLLIKALQDPDSGVRQHTVVSIGLYQRHVEAIQPLIKCLADEEWLVRTAAVFALEELRAVEEIEVLTECLDDEVVNVRVTALKAIAKLRGPNAYDLLVAKLKDNCSDVRIQAATSLGHLGDVRAVPVLREVIEAEVLGQIEDWSYWVVESAEEAILLLNLKFEPQNL